MPFTNPEIAIDLHTHTNLSDGSCSPAALLAEARQIGLKALAITDHDTLAGFDEAVPLAPEYNLNLICGVEISTQLQGTPASGCSIHVLGYFLENSPDEEFRNWLESISCSRRDRNLHLMRKLQSRRIYISWDDFPDLGPDRTARPHIARVLVNRGYAPDYQTVFDRYLNDAELADIKRNLPSTQEAIQKIRENGGIASLAHPIRVHGSQPSMLPKLVEQLAKSGLQAIEVYHSDHTPQDEKLVLEIAARFGLLITGGSDYHGTNKPDVCLGTGKKGNLHVPEALLESMQNALVGSKPATRTT
jgi:predicted metal-dependent phosphoesterase TrpH